MYTPTQNLSKIVNKSQVYMEISNIKESERGKKKTKCKLSAPTQGAQI